jgi:putative SOS response-associated peptidase YedK
MCNNFEQQIAWKAYYEALQAFALGIPTNQSELDLPQNDNIRIRDLAAVIRTAGNGVEPAQMRFGFPPPKPGAGPVFNFRSEGRRFGDSNRCLIPASAFFEFTGTKSPKTRHRFTSTTDPFLCIAGLWRPATGNQPADFTMLTTDPGPDIEPFHSRQIVVLPREDWAAWLYLTKPSAELLKRSPAGSFTVETFQPAGKTKP